MKNAALAIVAAVILSACGSSSPDATSSADAGPVDSAPSVVDSGASSDTAPADIVDAGGDALETLSDASADADAGDTERAHCLAGAPRLEWRTFGCFDTSTAIPGAPSGFYCSFKSIDPSKTQDRCLPTPAGAIAGYASATCDPTAAFLGTSIDFEADRFANLATVHNGPNLEAHHANAVATPAAGAWWDLSCVAGATPFPYSNAEGKSLVINGPAIDITLFAVVVYT